MPVYSHSKLATYENCPRQYRLRYIDRIEPPEGRETIEAFLGRRVHEALEKLYRELIFAKLNSLNGLLAYYKNQWEMNWHDSVVMVKKKFGSDHYEKSGKVAISGYYKRHHPFNKSKTLATEHLLTFRIDGYTIRGFVDRLEKSGKGFYEIHDYKTSASLPSQDRLDSDRQLALYQIGIKDNFRDAEEVRLMWHYLRFDKEFSSSRSEAQLGDLKKEVVSLIKTIEKDTRFEPMESNLCDWCVYLEYCPAKAHEMKVRDLPRDKYLREKGGLLIDRHASSKIGMKSSKRLQAQLQLEFDFVKEAAGWQ